MKIGLIVSIGLCILAFNWTTYDINEMPPIQVEEMPKETYIERTVQQKRKPPPPVVEPSTEIIPDDKDIEYTPEPEPEVIEDKIVVDTETEPTELPPAPVVEKKEPAASPLPEPELPVKEVEYVVVEEMPRFTGCEDIESDKDERRMCADKKLLNYIYSNIKYPAIARQNRVEGLVVISFVVAKDGSIGKVKVVKDIGAGCGKEAARVVKNMPDWIPGKQRNKKVAVRYNFPVKFKLQ